MKSKTVRLFLLFFLILAASITFIIFNPSNQRQPETLRVGIAPYQDMAMLAAAKPMGIDKKHGLNIDLVSMQWDELTPAIASSGPTVDVAFASLTQFIAQEPTLNANSSDPVVFFYPAYVFRGGGFVSFNPKVPIISKADLTNLPLLKRFLSFKFAVQAKSSYEILLYDLARRATVNFSDVPRFNMDSSDGLLAAINGSVDVAAAGLTQKNEAIQRKGRVVLEMDSLGQVDIAGFIARQSTIKKYGKKLANLVNVWVDSIDYVYQDINQHSNFSLDYLRRQSSTKYTKDQYRSALAQEWLPRSITEVEKTILNPSGKYYYGTVVDPVTAYYIGTKLLKNPPRNIEMKILQQNFSVN